MTDDEKKAKEKAEKLNALVIQLSEAEKTQFSEVLNLISEAKNKDNAEKSN